MLAFAENKLNNFRKNTLPKSINTSWYGKPLRSNIKNMILNFQLSQFFTYLQESIKSLPPLHKKRNPTVAAIVGALGNIFLALYLRFWSDFCILFVGIIVALSLAPMTMGASVFFAMGIGSWYGYYRVKTSNEKL